MIAAESALNETNWINEEKISFAGTDFLEKYLANH